MDRSLSVNCHLILSARIPGEAMVGRKCGIGSLCCCDLLKCQETWHFQQNFSNFWYMHLWSFESLQWNRKLTKIDNVSNWTICWKLLKFVFCVIVQMCSPWMCSEEDFSVWFCLQSRIPSKSVTQLFLFACSLTRKGASIYYPLVTPLAQLWLLHCSAGEDKLGFCYWAKNRVFLFCYSQTKWCDLFTFGFVVVAI